MVVYSYPKWRGGGGYLPILGRGGVGVTVKPLSIDFV